MAAVVRTLLDQLARRRPAVYQESIRIQGIAADTYTAFGLAVKTPITIEAIDVISEEPMAAGTNTLDIFRNRASTDTSLITQYDPDTHTASTLASKTVLTANDANKLIAGDTIAVKAVHAGSTMFDITVMITYSFDRVGTR